MGQLVLKQNLVSFQKMIFEFSKKFQKNFSNVVLEQMRTIAWLSSLKGQRTCITAMLWKRKKLPRRYLALWGKKLLANGY